MQKALFILLIFLQGIVLGQLNVSNIKELGITSEQDLQKMGLSSSEITALKQQYFNGELESKKNIPDLSKNAELNPKEETKIVLPVPNIKKEKEDSSKTFYGKNIFVNGSVHIQENSDRIKAPHNYILGSGDVISVVIWGTSEFSGTFKLDEYGNITPSLVGRISLKGKKFSDAQKIIKSAFARVYDLRNSKISTEISYSKVINVSIVGEVTSPGTYSIPSINSAFNFLSLAGGVTDLGSLRNIKIIHADGNVDELDVYKFLNKPEIPDNKYLNNGDFILVPTMGNVVSAEGVKRPQQFELKSDETLSDFLIFAGGVSQKCFDGTAHIERLTNGGVKIIDVEKKDFSTFKLQSGDKISFYEIDESVLNSISIRGSVVSPGKYSYIQNETLKSLVERSGGPITASLLSVGHIYRLNQNGTRDLIRVDLNKMFNSKKPNSSPVLLANDIVNIFDSRKLEENHTIRIAGIVRKPNNYPYSNNMLLKDLILIAGGVKENADLTKVDIERVDFTNGENGYVKVIEVDLNTMDDFKLKPYDIVNIRRLPEFSFQQVVSIVGEVKYPGNYSISGKSENLFNIIERAGGVTSEAFLEGGYIEREEDSVGLVVIKIGDLIKSQKSKYNYLIKPKDIIHIPKESNIVSIMGEIGYTAHSKNGDTKISCPYSKNKRAGRYIRNYGGGFGKNAKKYNVYVIRQNGLVEDSKFFGLIRPIVKKGDVIKVEPKKPKKPKTEENRIDWNRTIESLSVKITGLATFWVLAQQINP